MQDRRLALLLLTLALAACNQPVSTEASSPAPVVAVAESEPPAPAPAGPAATTDSSQAGVEFTITQVSGDCNPETPYRARLNWKIDDPAKSMIVIRAESPENGDMATHDSQEYWAETADWVWPGMPFYLIDRSSGEVLASLTAGPEACD